MTRINREMDLLFFFFTAFLFVASTLSPVCLQILWFGMPYIEDIQSKDAVDYVILNRLQHFCYNLSFYLVLTVRSVTAIHCTCVLDKMYCGDRYPSECLTRTPVSIS